MLSGIIIIHLFIYSAISSEHIILNVFNLYIILYTMYKTIIHEDKSVYPKKISFYHWFEIVLAFFILNGREF